MITALLGLTRGRIHNRGCQEVLSVDAHCSEGDHQSAGYSGEPTGHYLQHGVNITSRVLVNRRDS